MTDGRIRQAAAAFQDNWRVPNLRYAQLSFGSAFAAEWALTVGLAILAFRTGGATAVGVVAMARMLPSVLVAPLISGLVDRHRRERVLLAVCLVRGAALAGAALSVAVLDLAWPAYACAAVATLAHTLYRPAHSALLPSLCKTPAALTSANVVRGLLDSLSALLGPLAAGAVVAVLDVQGVFAGAALATWWAGWLIARVDYEAPPQVEAVASVNPVRDIQESFIVIRRQRALGVLCGLTFTQSFIRGCFNVFVVVIAIQLLDLGEPGVGLLTAAFGFGAVLGSFVAALLIGRTGFARYLGAGIALWGLPFALLALASQTGVAFALLAVVGMANSVVDVTGYTLLQRLVPDSIMGRFFTSLEAAFALGVALGAIAVPGLIALVDERGALLVVGLIAPAAVASSWVALRRLDHALVVEDVVLDHLQSLDMFRPLPMASIAALAAAVTDEHIDAGQVVVAQGTAGDDVFVIVTGHAEVIADGFPVAALGPGECFGEIAALGGGIRTSTVVATSALTLHRLPGRIFVSTVTGYTPSFAAAQVLVEERRGPSQPAAES